MQNMKAAEKLKNYIYSNTAIAFLSVFFSFLIIEFAIGNVSFQINFYRLTLLQTALNLAIYFSLWMLFVAVFRKRSTAAIAMLTLAAAIAIAEMYVIRFRGRVILPLDFYALRTVINVFTKYSFWPGSAQLGILGLCLLFIAGVLSWKQRAGDKDKYNGNWTKTALRVISPFIVIGILLYTNLLGLLGFQKNLYHSMWNTSLNGAALNFVVNVKYSDIEAPKDYSPEKVNDIIKNSSDNIYAAAEYNKPHIIIIMNEAWADLSIIGIKSSEDLFEGLYSYDENMISGYTYVSTFAGHTANAEYEFLTGNTMAFTPMETVAYQLYVKGGEYSLVGHFNSLGYETVAMHPYKSSGWNRVAVYGEFGFDDVYFIDAFDEPEFIRGYISDKSNYDKLIEIYEGKPDNEPLFMFNITMQNHGDYREKDIFDETVYAVGHEIDERLSLYLTLIKESNNAFIQLLDYFSAQDEPTIVLMFGDHFPGLGDDFYTDYFGMPMDKLPIQQYNLLYKIPYVLWSNYDIGIENTADEISLNYMSAYLTELLNLPMTGYQKYLMDIYSEVPIINRPLYMGGNEEMLLQEGVYTQKQLDILQSYKIVQYCGVEDRGNRPNKLFFLDALND